MNTKVNVFNAISTIKELVEGQEQLVKAIEEIETTVAINNCTTRLEELKKADKMREEVIDYLIENGAEKEFISIPVDTLKEWKLLLKGSYKGIPCEVSGFPRHGKIKFYRYHNSCSISMI